MSTTAFTPAIEASAATWGVPSWLIRAIIEVESGGDPQAINYGDPGFAWGLMQMIPATARGLGYTGPMDALLTDPTLAIDLGTQLLAQNLQRTNGDVAWAVSAYNGGWLTRRADGTFTNQAYVDRVLAFQSGGGIAGGGAGAILAGFCPAPGDAEAATVTDRRTGQAGHGALTRADDERDGELRRVV